MLKCLVALGGALVVYAGGTSIAARQAPAPAAGTAAPDTPQGVVTRSCVSCHNDRTRSGNLSLQILRRRHRRSARRNRREDDPQAARGADAAARQPASERRRARRPGRRARAAGRRARGARADAGPAHLPAAQPRGVRAVGSRSARARRQRRRLPAARREERELRQHRRRAAAVADADAGVPDGGRRDQPARGRRSRRRRRAKRPTRCRAGPRSASRSRARRTARAAALSVVHTFPADGEYRFRVSFYHETTGALYGNGRAALHTAEAPEQVEISIDGERVALLDIDRWMNTSDPDGVNLRTEPIAITAGPHRVSARVHPPARRAGAGSDLAARVVAREHQHRRRLRDSRRCRTCATWRSPDRSPPPACRRRRAAQKIFTCHADTTRAAADGVRARDRVAPRVAGVPPPGRPSAISTR